MRFYGLTYDGAPLGGIVESVLECRRRARLARYLHQELCVSKQGFESAFGRVIHRFPLCVRMFGFERNLSDIFLTKRGIFEEHEAMPLG